MAGDNSDVYSRLGRLEGKLDIVIELQRASVVTAASIEHRVGKLEKFQTRVVATAAAWSAFVAGAIALVSRMFP